MKIEVSIVVSRCLSAMKMQMQMPMSAGRLSAVGFPGRKEQITIYFIDPTFAVGAEKLAK